MNKRENKYFVGLDVGSDRVKMLVGTEEEHAALPSVVGVGSSVQSGMRRGAVIDIEEVTSSISGAVEEAERVAGTSISQATISIDGHQIVSMNSRGSVSVARADREITADDLIRVEESAIAIQTPPNMEILHVVPRVYSVDGHDGIKDPLGMQGVRLEVEAHIILGSSPIIRNLNKCVANVGIEVEGQVLVPLAAAKAVLEKRDKELGAVLVDIGGQTTGIAIFEEGNILYSSIRPIGASHITNDIAIGLRVPVDIAEKIKIAHGFALPNEIEEGETIKLSEFDPQLEEEVERKYLAGIIEARLEEIFKMVREELRKVGRDGKLPAGVILSGGGAKMPGIAEFAKEALKLPARVGRPVGVKGFLDKIDDPAYATAVGLLLYSYENKKLMTTNARLGNVMARVRKVFKTLLP